MNALPISIARYTLCLALGVSANTFSGEFPPSRAIQLGASVDKLKPVLEKHCERTEELHFTGRMAAPFQEQVQINCFGLAVFGAPRKVEFMFNDGPLGHVWILLGAGEVEALREALQETFGRIVCETPRDFVFASGGVALRVDPPEVLVATPGLIAELTGCRGRESGNRSADPCRPSIADTGETRCMLAPS